MKHNPQLTTFAQELRKNMTKEERRLWYEYLNSYPYRFRRQVTVGNYILDFYCSAAKIAIELDGSQHYTEEGRQYDAVRSAYLDTMGIRVLRYRNWRIMTDLRSVCDNIDREVKARIGH